MFKQRLNAQPPGGFTEKKQKGLDDDGKRYTFNPTSRQGRIDTSDSLRIGQQDGADKYVLG